MKKCILLVIVFFMSCFSDKEFVKNHTIGDALGTTYSIIYLSETALDFQKEIDSIFQTINQSMSTYIPDSDISRINQGKRVLVDAMFAEVFQLSKVVYTQSNGYFDPTIGKLVNAWGFGPGKQMNLDSTKVDSLLQFVGFDKVRITDKNMIEKEYPEIYIDFNAIAKGYAIDRLGIMLQQKGIENYLIEVGGEVLTKGINQNTKKPWTVGIDDPQVETGRHLKKIISLKDRSLASSGNYRKFRFDAITGEKYVHTVDPKTGFTKNSNILAVSIIANDCATADAYATALMAMDLTASKALLKRKVELDGYIIYIDDKKETLEFMTPGFKLLLRP